MALPPKRDPRRPLHLAIRSTRILGGIGVLIGSCVLMPLMMRLPGGRGVFAPARMMFLGSVFYMVPGVLLFFFSVFMARRRFWAVVGALVVSSVAALFVVFAGVGIAIALMASGVRSPTPGVVLLAVWAVFALAFGQLIYHLAKSFEGIKHPPFGEELRGFEVLPAAPLMPGPAIIGPGAFVPAPSQPGSDPADGKDTTYDPAAPR
jgi:hypothetical protein